MPVPSSPYAERIAGTGLVEPAGEEIHVGTPVPGVVETVHVRTGDRVVRGDPLFALDVRDLRAEWERRGTAVLRAATEVSRLRALPRAEDLPPAEARVEEERARLREARTRLAMVERVRDSRAVSEEDRESRRAAVDAAAARLAGAEADLARLRAGAWSEDIAVAEAALAEAHAGVDRARADLERAVVRAPGDGVVLRVDVRPGEFAPAAAGGAPLVVLGAPGPLHLRVDVDEADAWRVRPGARAEACVRGNAALRVPLTFLAIEPRVVPKANLSGYTEERVDTRVLQVLFAVGDGRVPVYVGQQMDVFVEASAVDASPASVVVAAEGGVR